MLTQDEVSGSPLSHMGFVHPAHQFARKKPRPGSPEPEKAESWSHPRDLKDGTRQAETRVVRQKVAEVIVNLHTTHQDPNAPFRDRLKAVPTRVIHPSEWPDWMATWNGTRSSPNTHT